MPRRSRDNSNSHLSSARNRSAMPSDVEQISGINGTVYRLGGNFSEPTVAPPAPNPALGLLTELKAQADARRSKSP